MMIDIGFDSTTHSNSEMMLVDEGAPIVSRNSFSVLAAPVQASTSQTDDTRVVATTFMINYSQAPAHLHPHSPR